MNLASLKASSAADLGVREMGHRLPRLGVV